MTEFSEAARPQPTLEELADYNLRTLAAGFARDPGWIVTTLALQSPDGTPTFSLKADCDTSNRQMLDKLYKLAHADVESAETEVVNSPEHNFTQRCRRITSPHNMEIMELYTRVGDWEDFVVSVTSPDGK